MYDIVIIGAGPAGLTAALYGCRSEKKVLVIEKNSFGGQITHSPRVENYPGFAEMTGMEFADKLVEQVLAQGADMEFDCVERIEGELGNYKVICSSSEFTGKTIIIATGSHHRMLGLENEEKFTGEGISYCAVCDGAFYRDKDVAIIGGGNTALQEAVMLSNICSSVTIVQNLDFFTGEQKLIDEINAKDNITTILSATVAEILGDNEFKGIVIDINGDKQILNVDGVFVAIGQQPENEPFENVATLNDYGYIVADESCTIANQTGIFVAGDCRTKTVRQITTATADGAVAALAACRLV